MLFQIRNGAVELGANRILNKIDFEVRDSEKIAIVGRNGCGKTTLLNLIQGKVELTQIDESTQIIRSGKLNIGCLSQVAFSSLDLTVDEEISRVFLPLLQKKERMEQLSLLMQESSDLKLINEFNRLQEEFSIQGGYFYEKEYNQLFQKFGFSLEDKQRKLSTFSGGQLTKLAFIKLLLEKPDILLLDEPTNHLDIDTIEYLEEYLKSYKKAVIMVSHDRMFIDKVADIVYEIEYGITKRYVGSYSSFIKQKEQDYELRLKAYKKQQAEIERLEALIERFRDTPTKVSMTDSKMKQIEHMVKIEEPRRFDTKSFKAKFGPKRDTGKEVLTVSDLVIGYDKPLATVSFKQYKNQRIGVIGANGTGKSTLLKTIVGELMPLGGSFKKGFQVDIGYLDQQLMQHTSDKTVLNELWDIYPKLTETEVRSALGAFMFTKDDVFKRVSDLSGGERVRLALAKILQERPNFLILDEPTNHMDMIGKETLEEMLLAFEGTILFVSHDRYLVSKLAQSLIVFEESSAKHYDYTYSEYLEKRDGLITDSAPTIKEEKSVSRGKEDYLRNKERAKSERRLQRVKTLINELEEKIEEKTKETELDVNQSDYEKLCQLSNELEELENQLLALYEEQEELENLLK